METGRKRAKNVEANRLASSAISASFEYLNSIVIFRGGSILLWNGTGTARERHWNGWWEVGGGRWEEGGRGWVEYFPAVSLTILGRERDRGTHTQKKGMVLHGETRSVFTWQMVAMVTSWGVTASVSDVSTRFYPFHARSVMNFQMFYMSIVRLLVFDSLIQLKLELIQSSIGKMDLTWSQWGRAHLPPK